ncbi:MAG: hypothetical protein ACI9VM_000927 [Candidatus Azotimanducaceae bacterium]|jgi:hypothetical protein
MTTMRFLILTIALLPLMTFAQEGGTLQIGSASISYDRQSVVDTSVLYYKGTALVASTHDANNDGVIDGWLQYQDDFLTVEAHDTIGDGEPDAFVYLDQNEVVTTIEGSPSAWEKPDVVQFNPEGSDSSGSEASAAPDDLVGSLDAIKIPGGGLPFGTILVWLLILGGGGYWYYSKRKKELS